MIWGVEKPASESLGGPLIRVANAEFCLDIFNGWQGAFEFVGELYKMREFGDTHRGGRTPKRIFDDNLSLRFAENQPDARLIT